MLLIASHDPARSGNSRQVADKSSFILFSSILLCGLGGQPESSLLIFTHTLPCGPGQMEPLTSSEEVRFLLLKCGPYLQPLETPAGVLAVG